MLTEVAEGVLIHTSEFCQTNAVVVQGGTGVLLIDAGVRDDEMACLANDLSESGETVVLGFSTHPHWDHLLWHPLLGDAPRHGTARCAATVRERLPDAAAKERVRPMIPEDIVDRVPLDLLGVITGLAEGTAHIPWDGPRVRIIEHQAHADGHASLLLEDTGVLVAGDMLSDVLVPIPNFGGSGEPIEDYLTGLRLLEGLADEVQVIVPGHGPVGGADEVRARIDRDRAYLHALRAHEVPDDPRIGRARPGWEWVAGVHEQQVRRLDAASGASG